MDEMTMFADLRPTDASLSDDDLAQMRAELFGNAGGAATPPGDSPVFALGPAHARSGRTRLGLAAAAVAAVGLVGVWAVVDRSTTAPAGPVDTLAPAADPPGTTPTSQARSAYDVPLISLGDPGWTLTMAITDTTDAPRAVVLLSDEGIDGAWIEVIARGGAIETADTVPAVFGRWTSSDHTTASGARLDVRGWDVAVEQLAVALTTVEVEGDEITFDRLPDGATLADDALVDGLGTFAEYHFAHTDGRVAQVTFLAGGERAAYQRTGPEEDWPLEGRRPIRIDGTDATIVEWTAGEYRVDIQRGFWNYEFNVNGFASVDEVVALVEATATVDETTWVDSLPPDVYVGDRRAAAVDELITDIALPPDFDRAALVDGGADSRYHVIAEVSGTIACGWVEELLDARADADPTREAVAVAALASSRRWPMLIEIDDQGGWSSSIWSMADAAVTWSGGSDPTLGSPLDAFGCRP